MTTEARALAPREPSLGGASSDCDGKGQRFAVCPRGEGHSPRKSETSRRPPARTNRKWAFGAKLLLGGVMAGVAHGVGRGAPPRSRTQLGLEGQEPQSQRQREA